MMIRPGKQDIEVREANIDTQRTRSLGVEFGKYRYWSVMLTASRQRIEE